MGLMLTRRAERYTTFAAPILGAMATLERQGVVMKRAAPIVLTVLCLCGSAAAACNTTGRYLGGRAALPPGLTPECGTDYALYSGYNKSQLLGRTLEMYRVRGGFDSLVSRVLNDAAKSGYTLAHKDFVKDPFDLVLAYTGAGGGIVVQILELDGAVFLVTIK